MLREDPALEQREMISGSGVGGGGSAVAKGLFLSSKSNLDMQRSISAGGGGSGSGGRASLEGSSLRNLDEMAGEDEVKPGVKFL